jgi:hypothetical protein
MPRLSYDEFVKEQTRDPLVIEVKGREFVAPPEVPWTAFDMAQELEGKELGGEETQELMRRLITTFWDAEAWEYMQESGVGPSFTMKIVNALLVDMVEKMPEPDPKAMSKIEAVKKKASRSPSKTRNGSSR